MIYLKLFYEFFKVGLFAIGGGLATIPFLYQMGEKTAWFSANDLTNMIAISESTPGPTGINMATYVGNTIAGLPGGLIATIGIVTPSVIIIMLVSKALQAFKDNKYVAKAMIGVRACSIGLISYAVVKVLKTNLLDISTYETTKKLKDLFDLKLILIFIITFVLYKKFKCHPVYMILLSALLGLLICGI